MYLPVVVEEGISLTWVLLEVGLVSTLWAKTGLLLGINLSKVVPGSTAAGGLGLHASGVGAGGIGGGTVFARVGARCPLGMRGSALKGEP